jgi:hypothetical protein
LFFSPSSSLPYFSSFFLFCHIMLPEVKQLRTAYIYYCTLWSDVQHLLASSLLRVSPAVIRRKLGLQSYLRLAWKRSTSFQAYVAAGSIQFLLGCWTGFLGWRLLLAVCPIGLPSMTMSSKRARGSLIGRQVIIFGDVLRSCCSTAFYWLEAGFRFCLPHRESVFAAISQMVGCSKEQSPGSGRLYSYCFSQLCFSSSRRKKTSKHKCIHTILCFTLFLSLPV